MIKPERRAMEAATRSSGPRVGKSMPASHPIAQSLLATVWSSLGSDGGLLDRLSFHGEGALRSPFAVTDLAAASFGSAALAISELVGTGRLRARLCPVRPTGQGKGRLHILRRPTPLHIQAVDPAKRAALQGFHDHARE
jgi:hypothetical protein